MKGSVPASTVPVRLFLLPVAKQAHQTGCRTLQDWRCELRVAKAMKAMGYCSVVGPPWVEGAENLIDRTDLSMLHS